MLTRQFLRSQHGAFAGTILPEKRRAGSFAGTGRFTPTNFAINLSHFHRSQLFDYGIEASQGVGSLLSEESPQTVRGDYKFIPHFVKGTRDDFLNSSPVLASIIPSRYFEAFAKDLAS